MNLRTLSTSMSSLLQSIDHGARAVLAPLRRPRHDDDAGTEPVVAAAAMAGPADSPVSPNVQ